MQGSTHEVEIKLPYPSAEAAREGVRELGANESRPRLFEDNVVFDLPDGSLKSSGKVLRLRRVGDVSLLTYKAPVEGDRRHKVRIEHETRVADADAVERLLEGLGYAPGYRYQKYRTKFRLEDLEICLDETPIGCYVELEGEPAQIDRAAEALGFRPDEYVRETYRELHKQFCEARGVELGDLLLEAGNTDGDR